MLEGKIGDFSLPDLFQLVALTKKSGALNVERADARGRILFKAGEICFAVADVERVAIGARLVQAGLASEEDVLAVLERRRAEGAEGSLSQTLLEAADVDEGALDAFIRASIEDAVFELMRVTEGSFSFDASEEPDGTVGLTVSTEHLVVEGGRRMAEWAAIREHVPSSDAVLAVSPGAGAAGTAVTVTAEQWAVLTLVDGRRTVREVVDLAGKGEFATTRLLAGMVTEGMVAVDADSGSALAELHAHRDRLRRIEALELGSPPAPRQPVATPALEVDRDRATAPAGGEGDGETAADDAEPAPAPAVALPAPVAAPTSGLLAEVLGDDGASAPASADGPSADGPSADGPSEPSDTPQDTGTSAPNGTSPTGVTPNGTGGRGLTVDRSQVARELASLVMDDDAPSVARPATTTHAATAAPEAEALRRLTRDEDVNKGLLLRLIDGVKGA